MTEPVRVLWLIKGLGPGGAEQLLVNHAAVRDRDALQYEATYLLPWKDHLVGDLGRMGVDTTCLGGGRSWDLRWCARLRRRLMQRPVDVVHFHSPYVAGFGRLVVQTLPRRLRPALVCTEHNRWPRLTRATRMLHRMTFRLDDVDLAVSSDVRASMPASLQSQVEVLIHGVDVAALQARRKERDAVRAELGAGKDEILAVTVANFTAKKGYPDLLAAARIVLDDALPVRFLIIGQGPLDQEIRDLHGDLGLGTAIEILGYRPDATRVVAGCDLFVLASHHEGLPVAIMEALALGVPVVATTVGGIPEAVTDGVEGLLVPTRSPDLLGAAIARVAGDPALRSTMSAAAAARGAAFGIEPAARRIEEIYLQIAPDRTATRLGADGAPDSDG